MKIIELLSNNTFKFPYPKGNRDIIEILNQEFEVYLKLLKRIDNEDKFTNTIIDEFANIEGLCNGIISAIKCYLYGSPYKAYEKFNAGIANLTDFILSRIRGRIKYSEGIILYRIRSSNNKYLTQEEIFHIPFEQRGKIRNQRFSINGLPCLYLGSSIYLCWEELNRPSFENLYVSKFKLKRSPKILDLTFSINQAKQILTKPNKDNAYNEFLLFNIVDKIVIFPLIISCSIINKGNNDPFKEEYIIPQILIEWINNEIGVDAIRYYSVSLPDYDLDNYLYTNYVFPVKNSIRNIGYCDSLSKMFELTKPISWNFAKSISGRTKAPSEKQRFDFNIINQTRSYKHTEFGHMEQILDSMDLIELKTI